MLMQTMGGGSALPALDPTDPSLKTETKRIWSRVKKDEKRAQLGEVHDAARSRWPPRFTLRSGWPPCSGRESFQTTGQEGGTTASRA